MSFRCGHCGGRHNNSETAQACAERARQRRGVPEEAALMPSGHYMVEMRDAAEAFLVHIEVRQLTGRWHAHYVVNVYDENDAVTPVPDKFQRDFLMNSIRNYGFRLALKKFGQETHTCPICMEELTDRREQISGVHRDLKCSSEVFG